MVSQLKVNEIIKQSGSSITIGVDGDTVSGPFTNVPAFEAYLSSSSGTVSNNVATKVQFDTEIYDTDGTYDNSSNYRFTPGVAGKYFIYAQVYMYMGSSNVNVAIIHIYKNGSSYMTRRLYHLVKIIFLYPIDY